MAKWLLAMGLLAMLAGAALMLPVVMDRTENGVTSGIGVGVEWAGCGLALCGLMALIAGVGSRRDAAVPAGARAAILANIVFVAFFALEFSDRLVRQHGRMFYWSTFLTAPALLLLWGLLAARPWAWWTARGVAVLATGWFLVFAGMIPFAKLQTHGVAVPWNGRVYMAAVSLAFAGILAAAFRSLGNEHTRRYFGR